MKIGMPMASLMALEMLVEPFQGRPVVKGCHHQHRIGAGLLRVAREVDCLTGRIGAGAGDDRHASGRLGDAPLDHLLMLVVRERPGFPRLCRPGTRPLVPSSICQTTRSAERLFVHMPVLEGGHQRGE